MGIFQKISHSVNQSEKHKRNPTNGHFSFGPVAQCHNTQHTKLNSNGIVTIIVKPTCVAYLKAPSHCALFAMACFYRHFSVHHCCLYSLYTQLSWGILIGWQVRNELKQFFKNKLKFSKGQCMLYLLLLLHDYLSVG